MLHTIDIPEDIEPMITVHDEQFTVPLRDGSKVNSLGDMVDKATLMKMAPENVDGLGI